MTVSEHVRMETEYQKMIQNTKNIVFPIELIIDPQTNELKPSSRPIGQNDIGMVAWLIHCFTPQHPDTPLDITPPAPSPFNIDEDDDDLEAKARLNWRAPSSDYFREICELQIWNFLKKHNFPDYEKVKAARNGKGRWLIMIVNDMSFLYGSFGPKEDDLFYLASKFARQIGVPRIYISANRLCIPPLNFFFCCCYLFVFLSIHFISFLLLYFYSPFSFHLLLLTVARESDSPKKYKIVSA
jgi:hypothetical protein